MEWGPQGTMMVILEEKLDYEGKWAWVWGKVAQRFRRGELGPGRQGPLISGRQSTNPAQEREP